MAGGVLRAPTSSLSGSMQYKAYTAHTIVTSLLEEGALVAAVLWLLPRLGITVPLWGLIIMMVALGTHACVSYWLGRKALARQSVVPPGVGTRGRATTLIAPTGYVRVDGELWRASSSRSIDAGEEIAVTGRERMTLLIRPVEKAHSERKVDAGFDNR